MAGYGRVYPPLAERFEQRVDRTPGFGPRGDCWRWTGSTTKRGYGQIGRGGGRAGQRVDYAHRVAFELARGIDELPRFERGKCAVCHECDNPTCVNPDHLFLGTAKTNVDDMIAKGRKYISDQRGEANNLARLTDEQVRAIRTDRRTYQSIADDYDIVISHVCNIKHGVAWPHLT